MDEFEGDGEMETVTGGCCAWAAAIVAVRAAADEANDRGIDVLKR